VRLARVDEDEEAPIALGSERLDAGEAVRAAIALRDRALDEAIESEQNPNEPESSVLGERPSRSPPRRDLGQRHHRNLAREPPAKRQHRVEPREQAWMRHVGLGTSP
jgi:hypothetical protein